ncbi:MAG: glycosyl hydrolase family 28-related protein, partial [Kiritimatiellaeota bacterium]|nr:glycosyl hydrolase family 28-related protein [Kiritimatiellota bacterium]
MNRKLLLTLVASLLANCGMGAAAEYSALWGRNGELWTPQSRLPDFSWAGYHCGEKAPPVLSPGVSVKKFGAKGDGTSDDTQAFLDSLEKAPAGAIEVPPGRYKITKILEITRPGIVLRGAGPAKSILFCPTPLNEIKPNWGATTSGKRTSNYSWSGGFVWIKGNLRAKPLATVTAEAARGAQTLKVSSAEKLHV